MLPAVGAHGSDRRRPWFARMYERVTPAMEARGMAANAMSWGVRSSV
jgi:hypothetical protein